METLIHLPSIHPDAYNITWVVLGLVLGKYKIVLLPIKFLLERLDRDGDKLVAKCLGKGD